MPNQFQHGYQNPMYQQNQVPGKGFQGFQAQNTSASHPNSSAPAISSKSQVNPTANLTTPPEANPHSSYAFYQNPGNYGGQQAQGPVEYSKMYGAPDNGFGQKPFQKQQVLYFNIEAAAQAVRKFSTAAWKLSATAWKLSATAWQLSIKPTTQSSRPTVLQSIRWRLSTVFREPQ